MTTKESGMTAAARVGHTPTPWSIDKYAATAIRGPNYVIASCGGHQDNRRDAQELWDELCANAAHIVKCVNGYDAIARERDELREAACLYEDQLRVERGTIDNLEQNANGMMAFAKKLEAERDALSKERDELLAVKSNIERTEEWLRQERDALAKRVEALEEVHLHVAQTFRRIRKWVPAGVLPEIDDALTALSASSAKEAT